MKTIWSRSLSATLVLAVLLSLCACGGEPDYDQVQLDNHQSSAVLTLGMDRTAVDELLAQDDGWDEQTVRGGRSCVDYYGGESGPITVWFQNDQAVYFAVGISEFPYHEPLEASPWSIHGITLGSSKEDVEAAFGYPTLENTDSDPTTQPLFQKLSYCYLSDGTLLAADTGDESFSADFLLQNGTVILFGVCAPGYDLYLTEDAAQEEVTAQSTPIVSPTGYGLTVPAGCTYEPMQESDGLQGLRILQEGEDVCGLIRLPFQDPERLSGEGFTRPDFEELLRPLLGVETDSSNFVLTSSRYGSFMMELLPYNTRHYFFPGQNCFYDLWVQDGALSSEEEHSFLSSFHLDA